MRSMELRVDLSTRQGELRERGDMKRFAVRAVTDGAGPGPDRATLELDRALRSERAGWVGPSGDARIPPEAIRRLARREADGEGTGLEADWESGFSSMLAAAASRGWIASDGSVQAHVEWEE